MTTLIRSAFLKAVVLVLYCQACPATDVDECRSIKVDNANILPAYTAIKAPGDYCLSESAVQGRVVSGLSGREIVQNLSFLYVISPNVAIDFDGHSFESGEVGRIGVEVDRYYPYGSTSAILNYPLSQIRISSGSILTSRGKPAITLPKHVPSYLLLSDFDDRLGLSFKRQSREKTIAGLERLNDRRAFPDAHVNHSNTVESMALKASPITVQIAGRATRIAGNRIEVKDGRAGLLLWGEAPVIENNIFVFSGLGRNDSAAPIKLFQANNAVIRNNLFIIEDARFSPQQAISLISSDNVIIEGNRVFGGKQIVRSFDTASGESLSGNILLPYDQRPVLPVNAKAAADVDLSVRRVDKHPLEQDQFDF